MELCASEGSVAEGQVDCHVPFAVVVNAVNAVNRASIAAAENAASEEIDRRRRALAVNAGSVATVVNYANGCDYDCA